ncbi:MULTISPECIES: hypothetical protein [unclassified Caballeronia]|uniref:hypothetical protein n=1 Tax=unclassified Caballeronia TaxID=2646786 RepID=UPI00285530E1|nr:MULTISPECIES: hypothetical protein [unclassified Caballeronia]MDR5817045.1 hypothetical protein [Caballeronia sp. LZ033]MDR5823952.1 hypothetical protein [Caballeronia sp. LZ043]MDR5837392.1 hypothetical protein [Caballeronia sp. LZ034LL]MDR5881848.1 hypothetical protein [Caballeronia sp. LZ032]
MRARNVRTCCAIVLAMIALDVIAQSKPIAYPAKGQSAQQQQSDDGACYSWAKSNTGVDPANPATTGAQSSQSAQAGHGGQRLGGAARGAAGGAAIGAIAGDAGKGAAAGAVAGTMAGGARARQAKRAEQANAQSQSQGAMSTYYRAWSACMQGRGYTIQ